MADLEADVAVVGGGVVGVACAAALAGRGRSVVLVERHARLGTETTARNSQVLHAGLYYATGSLKAELCVRGRARLVDWCARHGVPHALVGKYVVAVEAAEEADLAALAARGRDNGVEGLALVDGRALTEVEPAVVARAALHSPASGIVDAHALVASLAAAARHDGAELVLRHALVAVEADGTLVLCGPDGARATVAAPHVVNAAGLDADRVAALAGLDLPVEDRQVFVKGSYFRVRRPGLVRHLVYPVPPRGLVGLGVHLTVELDGGLRLGPDAEPVGRDFDYDVDAARAPAFLAAARRYLRGLGDQDLVPDTAGVRPKLPSVDGTPRDFVLRAEPSRPGWVSLLGIESPGLTACLAIAERVATLVA